MEHRHVLYGTSISSPESFLFNHPTQTSRKHMEFTSHAVHGITQTSRKHMELTSHAVHGITSTHGIVITVDMESLPPWNLPHVVFLSQSEINQV